MEGDYDIEDSETFIPAYAEQTGKLAQGDMDAWKTDGEDGISLEEYTTAQLGAPNLENMEEDEYKAASAYTEESFKAIDINGDGILEKNEMQGFMLKMDADPRIIGSGPDGTLHGLGWFIRKTSLDEFPQFLNVLKGDMSLVGTRPPTEDEWNQYKHYHRARLATKPGLTGMWQVSGRSDITDFEEVVKLDMEYIKNWNIGMDIKIILKTVLVVLKGSGSK